VAVEQELAGLTRADAERWFMIVVGGAEGQPLARGLARDVIEAGEELIEGGCHR
jgi:hypothetical protein